MLTKLSTWNVHLHIFDWPMQYLHCIAGNYLARLNFFVKQPCICTICIKVELPFKRMRGLSECGNTDTINSSLFNDIT